MLTYPCTVSTWVQAFYAWRIHQLGKWVVLPGFIVLVGIHEFLMITTLRSEVARKTALVQAGGAWALAISVRRWKHDSAPPGFMIVSIVRFDS